MSTVHNLDLQEGERLGLIGPDGQVLATTLPQDNPFGWQSDFVGPGIEGEIEAVLEYDGELIIAGRNNLSAGSISNAAILAWDGEAWRRLGTERFGSDFATIISELIIFQGELIAAGSFTRIGERTIQRIARWDGTQWHPLGSEESNGVGDDEASLVTALAIHEGELIVGGGFNTVNGEVANKLARWDGSQWATLGVGPNNGIRRSPGPARVVALASLGNELIVAGDFDFAGAVETSELARWNGASWQAIPESESFFDPSQSATAMTVFDQKVYIAGTYFWDHLVTWDGTSLESQPYSLCQGHPICDEDIEQLLVFDNELYGVGSFLYRNIPSDITRLSALARWTGSGWHFPSDNEGAYLSRPGKSATSYNNNLLVGGTFRSAGDLGLNGLAAFDGQSWQAIPEEGGNGVPNGTVMASVIWNGELVIGGSFRWAGPNRVNGLARWDGVSWHAFEGPSDIGVGYGEVLALQPLGQDLFVAGNFDEAGGIPSRNIARYNTAGWSAIDTGYVEQKTIETMTVWQNQLIAPLGDDSGSISSSVTEIAAFDGSNWTSLHPAGSAEYFSSTIHALDVYQGDIYAAGEFNSVDGKPIRHIARYTGSAWQALSSDQQPNYDVVALQVFNDDLWVGGSFSTIGELYFAYLARWNGNEWQAVRNDDRDRARLRSVNALSVWNDQIVAAGLFDTPLEERDKYLGRHTGNRWAFFEGPVRDTPNSIVQDIVRWNDRDLFVGDFTQAGGRPAWRIAEFSLEPATIEIDQVEILTDSWSPPNSAIVSATVTGLISSPDSGVVIISSDQNESCKTYSGDPVDEFSQTFMCQIDFEGGGPRTLTARFEASNTHSEDESESVSTNARWPTQIEFAPMIPADQQTVGQPFDIVVNFTGAGEPTGHIQIYSQFLETLCVITLPDDRCTAVRFYEGDIELQAVYAGDLLNQAASATAPYSLVRGDLVFSPQRIDFGDLAIGQTSDPRVLSVRNVSGARLTINSIGHPAPPFEELPLGSCRPLPLALEQGEECTLYYQFTPGSPAEDASFIIQSSAADAPHVVFLRGFGIDTIFEDAFRW